VLEQWTTLAAAAAVTKWIRIGTFVANVMNRHPALVARMAATLMEVSGGRFVLGIGIGGHPAEHDSYGLPFPGVDERAARLTEAIAVIRALWSGGPVSSAGRYYPLRDAFARPAPQPAPSIIVGGETTGGARLAARIGDGWTAFDRTFARDEPVYREALEAAGRSRSAMTVFVAFEAGRAGEDALGGSPWIAAPAEEFARWQEIGADGAIVTARTTTDVDALIGATARW
jgi:alkanesulfonate monooxygenase SsuD/methylene tetrahydromethanopterin reductase-like flavin-dependent oxidoreductase (luciferase family)